LEHILYELLDNAIRFTLKHNPEGNYPPVTVSVSANESDIYFRISDLGGGIPKARYDHIWSYQARSQTGEFEEFKEIQQMPTNVDERASQASQMGHRHLGIGLTMSRVYAEYWGGELQVLTMDGHGTDAYVRIPRLGLNTENLGIEMQSHPVFKSFKHDKKKHHNEKKHEPKLKHKPIVSMPDQQTFDTSLTAETFSGNGWSQSHMIES
jgi:hypothetical protein